MFNWIKNLLTEPVEVWEDQCRESDPIEPLPMPEDGEEYSCYDIFDLKPARDIVAEKTMRYWKVEAIKKCREITGWQLREAKRWVDNVIEEEG
jgi:hypothetical protein